MQLRNALVRPFGLKVEPPRSSAAPVGPLLPGARVGIFRVFARRPDELLLGEDDRHLDFRVGVLLRDEGEAQYATISTVVRFHNGLGRAYFAVVRMRWSVSAAKLSKLDSPILHPHAGRAAHPRSPAREARR